MARTWEQAPAFPLGPEVDVSTWDSITVSVNGQYVRYATDSFTPSEFDLTEVVRPGLNQIALRVVKWSAASWLEDQDFYRFSGLFRSVCLRRLPHRPLQVESAPHAHELLASDRTVLRVSWMRRGVGGDNSWGARTLPQYCLPAGPLEFRFTLRGLL